MNSRCEYRVVFSAAGRVIECGKARACDICRNCPTHCPRHMMIREALGVRYLGDMRSVLVEGESHDEEEHSA